VVHIRDRADAGARCLGTLDDEMLVKEFAMVVMVVKTLWRQHRRNDRHFGFELDLHQRVDHRTGDEFVAVDAAVDNESRRDNGGVATALRQDLRL